MLYVIAEQLGFPGILNLIRYISFRAGAASATALIIGLLLGPWFISWLRATQGKGQPIRSDGPQSHLAKRGTPTMGGLLILISVSISVLLWMELSNPYVWACLLVTAGFGLIGWLDDYDKVKKAHHAGLSGKTRLALEFLIAGIATWLIVRHGGTHLYLPFKQGPVMDLGWFYIAFGAFVIVSFGNAVNLTDGLDGLATMPVIIASLAFLIISYLVGNAQVRDLSRHPARARRRRSDRAVDGDHRRRACLPVVQRAARRGLHGRHRQPRAGRRARRGRGRDPPRIRAGDRRRPVRGRGA